MEFAPFGAGLEQLYLWTDLLDTMASTTTNLVSSVKVCSLKKEKSIIHIVHNFCLFHDSFIVI
jgi:hypothetical protein